MSDRYTPKQVLSGLEYPYFKERNTGKHVMLNPYIDDIVKAMKIYANQEVKFAAQQQTDKLYTREEVVKIEKYQGIANLEFEMTSRIYQAWERRKALAREVLEGAPENKTLHITEEIKHLDALLKKIFLID